MTTGGGGLSSEELSKLYMIAEDENDYFKCLESATSRKNLTDGFQGCINYRLSKGCKFNGFYLCYYSLEGECDNCEYKSHPERFVGCLFCRRPSKFHGACLRCSSGFYKFIEDIFGKYIKGDLGQGSFRLYQMDFIKEQLGNDKKIPPNFSNEFGGWAGFVSKYDNIENGGGGGGNYTHIIPNFTKEQIEKVISQNSTIITWDNIHIILLSHLNNLGIYLYNIVQIK
jgi:hypothetical protein